MDWVLSALYLFSIYLVIRDSKLVWALTCFISLLWIYYAIFILRPPQWGLVPGDAVAMFLAATTGVMKWNKKSE